MIASRNSLDLVENQSVTTNYRLSHPSCQIKYEFRECPTSSAEFVFLFFALQFADVMINLGYKKHLFPKLTRTKCKKTA